MFRADTVTPVKDVARRIKTLKERNIAAIRSSAER
jgi:hypothetical protein